MSIDCNSKKETSSVSEISNIVPFIERRMERSIKLSLYTDDGSEKKEVLVPNSSDEEPAQGLVRRDEIGSLTSYNLTKGSERVNSVQSWVNNSRPHSPSSIENGISFNLNLKNKS